MLATVNKLFPIVWYINISHQIYSVFHFGASLENKVLIQINPANGNSEGRIIEAKAEGLFFGHELRDEPSRRTVDRVNGRGRTIFGNF